MQAVAARRWCSRSGNFGLLTQYGIDWSTTKPLSRVKEGVEVIRTFLDDGAITHDGEFFQYHGLFTFARPVQDRLPVKMGAMKGPKSFEVSAEFSDGCHHALSYTREAYDYMMEHCTIVRSGPARTCRTSTWPPGWCSPAVRTPRRPRTPPAAWSVSTPPPCRTSSCAATASSPRRWPPSNT